MKTESQQKTQRAKTRREKQSPIYKACSKFLKNPLAHDADDKIDEALTNCAILSRDSDIDLLLSHNSDHPNMESLIDVLDFYSTSHVIFDSNEDGVGCELFLIPVVIGCTSNSPIMNSDQLDKIAKSFRVHNFLSDEQSVVVYSELLDIEQLEFNYVRRKRMLIGLLESIITGQSSSMLSLPSIEQPTQNMKGGLSVCLKYLPLAVMGDPGDFIDMINDDDNKDSELWREYVGTVLAEGSDNLFASVDCPFYYDEAVDNGVLNYAITITQLKITNFVKSNNISPSDCKIFIEKGDFIEGHDVFIYYKHGDKVLDAEKIQLPIPNSESHLDSIIFRYLDCVFACCNDNNIGGVELFGLDQESVDSQHSRLNMH